MPLSDYCSGSVITASPDETIQHAASLMRDKKVGAVVITEEEKPVGILTDRDLVLRVLTDKKGDSSVKIRDVMTRKPHLVPESIGIWELIKMMKKNGVRRFPIVSGEGKLVGMITMDDLIELMGMEISGLARTISTELGHEGPIVP